MEKEERIDSGGKDGLPRSRRHFLKSASLLALLSAFVPGMSALLAGCTGKGRSSEVKGGETRPVLDPFRFSDPRVQSVYMTAKSIPEVLDKLFCYCFCERPPFNHKSLLSCYATPHAAG